jgi:hypothetical protein
MTEQELGEWFVKNSDADYNAAEHYVVFGDRANFDTPDLLAFVNERIAAEREACAKIAEDQSLKALPPDPIQFATSRDWTDALRSAIAAAIRKREDVE